MTFIKEARKSEISAFGISKCVIDIHHTTPHRRRRNNLISPVSPGTDLVKRSSNLRDDLWT